jgi:hypothetical protein
MASKRSKPSGKKARTDASEEKKAPEKKRRRILPIPHPLLRYDKKDKKK